MKLDEPIAKALAQGSEPTTSELYDLGCGRTLGRYTILRRIATGGMAEVYSARARGIVGFERKVAIKKILPQLAHNDRFIDMLVDEAKITVHLTHSSIAQVYELGLEGEETYFIVMEYVDGRPLSRIMQRLEERNAGAVPIEQAAYIVTEVARGLDHAHRCTDSRGQPLGIVHRDITPQNVLISYGGEVKLIDFGIARAEGRIAQTQDGVIKGKLRYLAPEIALGDDPDHRADLYNCGILLFEMLTGEALFSPRSDLEAIQMASEARVRSPRLRNPKVPEALEEIVMRALRREPAERYQSAKELASDLERFLARAYPTFSRTALGDLMTAMYREEIAIERRIDARAEKLALEGIDLANEATAIAPMPDTAKARAYRQLVTRVHAAPEPDQRVKLAGADGGQPMQVVLADEPAPRPASGRAAAAGEGTVARPRAAIAADRGTRNERMEPENVALPRAPSPASPASGSGRSPKARPGRGEPPGSNPEAQGSGKTRRRSNPSERKGDAARSLGFATIDDRSPSDDMISDEIVSAMPTMLRVSSDARTRAEPAAEAEPANGLDAEARGPGEEASEGPEMGLDDPDEATHRAISTPGDGSLRDAIEASSSKNARRTSSPRGARSRPRANGTLAARPPPLADPADSASSDAAGKPSSEASPPEDPEEGIERTIPSSPPPGLRVSRGRGRGSERRLAEAGTRGRAGLENSLGDILIAVAIFIVVACCLILALGRGPEARRATGSAAEPTVAAQEAEPAEDEPPSPAAPEPSPEVRAQARPEDPPEEVRADPPNPEASADPLLKAGAADAEIQDVEDEEEQDRPRTPRASRGLLIVNTWPGSTVYVDGKRRGVTPLKLRLSPRKYKISLKSEKGEILSSTRVIETGKTTSLIHRWPL